MSRVLAVKELAKQFGKNHFLEVSRKTLIEGGEREDFLLITRGFTDASGKRHSSLFVTLPDDPAMKAWLARALMDV